MSAVETFPFRWQRFGKRGSADHTARQLVANRILEAEGHRNSGFPDRDCKDRTRRRQIYPLAAHVDVRATINNSPQNCPPWILWRECVVENLTSKATKLIQIRQDLRVKRGESSIIWALSRGRLRRANLPTRGPLPQWWWCLHRPDCPEDRSGPSVAEEFPSGNRVLVRKPNLGWLLRVESALVVPPSEKHRSSTATVEKSVEKIRVNAPKFLLPLGL